MHMAGCWASLEKTEPNTKHERQAESLKIMQGTLFGSLVKIGFVFKIVFSLWL